MIFTTLPCPKCGRPFRARWTHEQWVLNLHSYEDRFRSRECRNVTLTATEAVARVEARRGDPAKVAADAEAERAAARAALVARLAEIDARAERRLAEIAKIDAHLALLRAQVAP